ncbi:very short patch repair endonuclease [Paenibacillus sp. P22]|uniref:very short patch repair endonuclease n=1 Tax=Paenibacillus sp. P22 TaxID=483908 RepID=UPI001E35EF4A|nr:very short patch repair endonuclease [Paenibacillus sp. P22]
MSKIRGKNTKPELVVRSYLHQKGFRYRLHVKRLPGKPDLVLTKHKALVFVHGCFWHGHEGCKYFRIPKSNVEYWSNKIHANIERDRVVEKALQVMGWNVIVLWECELKKDPNERLDLLVQQIKMRQ